MISPKKDEFAFKELVANLLIEDEDIQVTGPIAIVGMYFTENGDSLVEKAKKNSIVILVRDPYNRHDKNAVKVMMFNPKTVRLDQIGFVQRHTAKSLAEVFEKNKLCIDEGLVFNIDAMERAAPSAIKLYGKVVISDLLKGLRS